MPIKGMRSICFSPQTPSFNYYLKHSSLSDLISPPPPPPLRLQNFPESTVDQTLDAASNLILKWNLDSSSYAKVTSLFHESKSEAKKFITHIGQIQKVMHLLVNEDSTSVKLVRAQTLMIIAMKRLEKEFFQILSMNRVFSDYESSSRNSTTSSTTASSDFDYSDFEVQELNSIGMADLKLIAECMIDTGYTIECIDIYRTIRKSIVEEAINRIGFEKLSSSQIGKLDCEILEIKIKKWLEAMNISMRTIFQHERILCDAIFFFSDHIREACFSDISKDGANSLLGFPEQVLKRIAGRKFKSSPAPEKNFWLLDMYTSIAENWQNIERIFDFQSTSCVRLQGVNSLIKLGDSVRVMITEFEQSINRDSSKLIPHGGGVHNLTINTTRFLSLLADYSNVLVDILVDWTPPTRLDFHFDSFIIPDESPTSTVSTVVTWLITILLSKLDGKAKHYKEIWLSCLFLANNLRHVIVGVRTSSLRYLLGEELLNHYKTKTKQFAACYEKLAWGPIFNSLPANPTAVVKPRDIKEWFRRFNLRFEETYKKQMLCVVPDTRFRDEIKVSIARKLVPIYREFYDIHGGSQLGVRFLPEDIESYLSELFNGACCSTTSSAMSASSSHSRWHLQAFRSFR